MTKKLKQLFVDYGRVAIAIHFSIFFLTWGGFYIAISAGLDLQDVDWLPKIVEKGGNVAISYLFTQALKPIRIALTVVLTPLVASWLKRQKEDPDHLSAETKTHLDVNE